MGESELVAKNSPILKVMEGVSAEGKAHTTLSGISSVMRSGDFLHGAIKLPEWLNLGGDVRLLQLRRENAKKIVYRPIVMQLDLEGAVDLKKISLVGSVGLSPEVFKPASSLPKGEGGEEKSRKASDYLLSRRHYLLWRTTDHFSLRAGRYLPAFGIAIPDHTALTRSRLGFAQEDQVYGAEISWIDENWSAHATSHAGYARRKQNQSRSPMGAVLHIDRKVGDFSKLGFSLLADNLRGGQRIAAALSGGTALGNDVYFLAEFDEMIANSLKGDDEGNSETIGFLNLGWEFLSGIHLNVRQEWAYSKTLGNSEKGKKQLYSVIELQYYPLPHWEFLSSLSYSKEWPETRKKYDVTGLLQLHYYF